MILSPTKKTRPADFPERMDPADFLAQMLRHFRVYYREGSPEEAQWMDGLTAILSVYRDDVLADGCLWFLQHRKEPRFPLPAEIITVCDEITKERSRPALLAQEAAEVRASPYSRSRTRLVLDLLRGDLGKRAARENWIGPLVDYARQHAALPKDERLLQEMRIKAQEQDQLREACYRGDGWPKGSGLAAMCAAWAESIEARNRLWARVILGQEREEALYRRLKVEEAA